MAGKVSAEEVTVIATDALPTRPLESATLAVMWCVPGDSVLIVKVLPVPMRPSTFDTQARLADTSPASSMAVAVKVSGAAAGTCAPDAGVAIVTWGGLLLTEPPEAVTVTVICAVPERPFESVARAVMRCVPRASEAVPNAPPTPIWPFRLENQLMLALTLTSSPSVAATAQRTAVAAAALKPDEGEVMVTVGVVVPIAIVTVLVAVRPPLSVTVAVMTWRLLARCGATTVAPTPRAPATSDDQWIWLDRSPSR